MKKLCLLFSLCPVFLWGQVKLDFENGLPGNSLQFPAGRWEVNSEHPLKGQFSLKHAFDNSQSDLDVITFSIPEPDMDSLVTCSFVINYEYNPSGSNNWCFYFLSEGDAFEIKSEAYFNALMLGVNQKGTDDSLYIYQYKQGEILQILNCGLHCENDMGKVPWEFRISIKKNCYLVIEGSVLGTDLDTLAFMEDNFLPDLIPEFLGCAYNYTSSKDRLLSLDEISFSSSVLVDTTAPVLGNTLIDSPGIVEFAFSEKIFSQNIVDFNIDGGVDSVWMTEEKLYLKLVNIPANDTKIEYSLSGIADRKGNTVNYEGSIIYFYPGYHDIIFTEIMADPSPPVYLPEREYLEIYNRSGHVIDLSNWELHTGTRVWLIPGIQIGVGEYLVLYEGHEPGYYSDSISCFPLFPTSSVLSNSGQILCLYTAENILIDAIEYSSAWYGEDFVYEGGWSLEKVDLENLCAGQENWKPSVYQLGGTPGFQNSINGYTPDGDPPYIEKVIYENDSVFRLSFNEIIDRENLKSNESRILESNPGLYSIRPVLPFFKDCKLTLNRSGPEILVFQEIWKDCEGNIQLSKDSVFCIPPYDPKLTSIIITEILFAPWPGCPEFIELYNASNKVLSLYDLKIKISEPEQKSTGGEFICEEEILFYPGEYLVLSANPIIIQNFYDMPEQAFAISLPGIQNLPDKGAKISIFDRSNNLVDEALYGPDNHFPLINDFHGVSIERVFIDRETGVNSTWQSASSLAGFATPGFRNSQFRKLGDEKGDFFVEEEIFTPDNDGYNDLAVIRIKMDKEGYLAMIRVFDAEGRLIKWLGNNVLLGTDDKLCWDGRDELGRICPSGIYLVHMEAYHISGSRREFKEAVVLGR